MIVRCPSCDTNYRHAAEGPSAGVVCRCARCDDTFPLAAPVRRYLVLPSGGGRIPVPRGMDDPLLAGRLGDALPSEVPAAAPADVTAGDRAAAPAPSQAPPRRLVAALVTLIPSAYGAGLGYYLAGEYGVETFTWPVIGAAIGLLVGWGSLAWVRPKD